MSVEIVPKPPQEIVDAIRDYIRSHRALNEPGVYLHETYNATDPAYIPYVPDTDAIPLMCWRNVRRRANLKDGLAVYGWAIWESEHRGRYCHVAQPHAVLQPTESPSPVCISPHVCLYPDSTILFMADPRIGYDHEAKLPRQPPILICYDKVPDDGERFTWAKQDVDGYIELSRGHAAPDNYHYLEMDGAPGTSVETAD